MKKSLIEAKADIESGIAKSLAQAPLKPEELEELEKTDRVSLVNDHEIDYLMADQVLNHAESEKARIDSQTQMTGRDLEESIYKKNKVVFKLEDPLDFNTN